MIQAASFYVIFWGEAALHAAYLTSETVRKTNEGQTTFEVIYGGILNIDNMWVHGCAA